MEQQSKFARTPLVAAAILTLLAAMWAGLNRMSWNLPPLSPTLAGHHGPLMVSGFLGTLIGMERAAGLGRRWAFVTPVLTALGAAALVLPLPTAPGALLTVAGSVGLVFVFAGILRKQPAMHNAVMALGSLLWVGGNLLWLAGFPIPNVVPWWAGYLVLTIAGERLELSRLLRLTNAARAAFAGAAAVLLAGLLAAPVSYTLGWRITGAAFLLLAAWLLQHDIARRTVRTPGLTRFVAICMLVGYVWLGAGGAIALIYGFLSGGTYDAALHTVFLGFVFSMIFGHAPIIFPSLLGVIMPFRPAFYSHLVLLHLSLLLRVAGDQTGSLAVRQWGGMLNVIALLLFLGNTIRLRGCPPVAEGPPLSKDGGRGPSVWNYGTCYLAARAASSTAL